MTYERVYFDARGRLRREDRRQGQADKVREIATELGTVSP